MSNMLRIMRIIDILYKYSSSNVNQNYSSKVIEIRTLILLHQHQLLDFCEFCLVVALGKRAHRGADTMKTSVGKLFLCSLLLIFSGQSIVNKQKKQYIATDVILDAKFAKSNQNGVDTYGKSYEVFWSNPDFGYLHYSGAESCPMPIPTIPDRFCALSDYVSAK